MKKLMSVLLLLSLILGLGTFARAEIVFGVIPLEDKAIMEKKFSLLADYLSAKMADRVVLKIGASYEEIEDGLTAGKIQLAYLGPVGAVKCNQANRAVIPLAKVVSSGSPFYKSYIIAPKDSPLQKASELQGKVFAFGDQGSTSSYLVPRYMLAKSGVKLADLQKHTFTGSHSNVVRAVLSGQAAAGGVKESVALKNQAKLKFLEISKPIPNFPFCANLKALGKDKSKQAQQLLIGLAGNAPELKAISKKYDGVVRASIGDYQIIKAIMKHQ